MCSLKTACQREIEKGTIPRALGVKGDELKDESRRLDIKKVVSVILINWILYANVIFFVACACGVIDIITLAFQKCDGR